MDDLTAFVNARLDEDEAAAKRVNGVWHEEPEGIGVVLVGGEPLIEGHIVGLTAHIARHDPARVLREIAAKRAIVAMHQPRQLGRWQICGMCRPVDPDYPDDLTSVPWPCPTVRQVAAVWSDHPDYQGEWAL